MSGDPEDILKTDRALIELFPEDRALKRWLELAGQKIAFQGLPELFTLSELQHVYETILDRPLDKRNFRKKILALEHIEQTEQFRRKRSHRPARLYRYTKMEER